MKKIYLLALCLGTVMLACCLPKIASAGTYDPITVNTDCSPKSVTSPQKVTVTIAVTNIADGDAAVPVTLYDPAGNTLSFTSGNANPLGMHQKATYVGEWNVTEAELKDGKIKYKIAYEVFDDSTEPPTRTPTSRVISVNISKASSSSSTSSSSRPVAEWKVSPSTASKGQAVTLTYTITNPSETDITNVQITNPNLTKDKINISRIGAGQKVTKTYQYTMGSKTVKAKPKVTYRIEGSDKVLTLANMSTKTIELEKGGVIVNLKATGSTDVEPGKTVELVCTITNNSNTTYTDVKISDPIIGDIATGIELKADGGKHTEKKVVTVNETADYVFHVQGTSSSKKELDMDSNPVHLVAIDMTKQLQLSVTAEAQSAEINDMPAEVEFAVTVRNVGLATGKDLEVKHGKTTIAKIASLEPDEEITVVKTLILSMGGKFQFTVSGVNEQGGTQDIPGNEVQVAYVEPTEPPPPPTIAPTDPPEEETPLPVGSGTTDEGGGGLGMTILWALGGLLVLAIIGVLAMIIVGRRRQPASAGSGEMVVDSIERGTRRDYQHRPNKTRGDTQRMRAQRNDDYEFDEEPAYQLREQSTDSYDEAIGLASDSSMHDLAAMYGRPDDAPSNDEPRTSARSTDRRSAEDATSAYLARIREADSGVDHAIPPRSAGDTGAYRRRRARSADA